MQKRTNNWRTFKLLRSVVIILLVVAVQYAKADTECAKPDQGGVKITGPCITRLELTDQVVAFTIEPGPDSDYSETVAKTFVLDVGACKVYASGLIMMANGGPKPSIGLGVDEPEAGSTSSTFSKTLIVKPDGLTAERAFGGAKTIACTQTFDEPVGGKHLLNITLSDDTPSGFTLTAANAKVYVESDSSEGGSGAWVIPVAIVGALVGLGAIGGLGAGGYFYWRHLQQKKALNQQEDVEKTADAKPPKDKTIGSKKEKTVGGKSGAGAVQFAE